jgi:S-adenosylmethionine hydrolase
MKPSGVVTLLTDFGLVDPFVGLMHGVVLKRFPEARVVDLCHAVEPQDVGEAAFLLERCYGWFAAGSVHVAVVDPGVGTDRAALALEADGHLFIAPDNGLVGALARRSDAVAHRVDLSRLGLPEPSRTFHGRDVFAPVAAELARGAVSIEDLGPRITPRQPPAAAPSRVVTIDRFGNLITNVEGAELGAEVVGVEIGGRRVALAGTYAEVPRGELVALVSSYGTLEIAVRDGNAAQALGVSKGEPVRLEKR